MNDNEIIEKYKKYEPFFSNWYIKRFIGEGGFAKVFEIVRNDFGSEYTSALKIITVSKTKTEMDSMRAEGMSDADIRESLKGIVEDTVREIQLMYKVRGNGNIVGYEDHEVVEHEDGMGWDIFIKMEYLTTLTGHIREQKGQIAKREIIKLGIDICHALESCQKYNIIHRDIKADNIFISENGDYKLGDFGIARIIERKDMELSKKGTSSYMAPEVYKGQPYSSAVDIYSLGMVLYRLVNNNRAPFLPVYPKPVSLDDRDRGLMMRMSGEKFPEPSQMRHNRLTEIITKACAYRPEDRYSSPMFMRQELEAILYDPEEVTNDDLIIIYEEQGASENSSFSQTSMAKVNMEDGATEVLRNDTAPQDNLDYTSGTEVKVLCKNCGSAINRDAAFCPACGATQRDVQPAGQKKKISKTIWIIIAICAVLLLGIIGLAVALLSSDDDSDTQESTTTESTTEESTTESTTEATTAATTTEAATTQAPATEAPATEAEKPTPWFDEKKLKITPQGDFTYNTSSLNSDQTKATGTFDVKASVTITETTKGAEKGFKKVTATFNEDFKQNPTNQYISWFSAFDRYTGISFEFDAVTLVAGKTNHKEGFVTIQNGNESYDIAVEFSSINKYPSVTDSITVTCPVDYDGAVFQIGFSSPELAKKANSIDYSARFYTIDELPYWGKGYYYFSHSNQ